MLFYDKSICCNAYNNNNIQLSRYAEKFGYIILSSWVELSNVIFVHGNICVKLR